MSFCNFIRLLMVKILNMPLVVLRFSALPMYSRDLFPFSDTP